MAQKRKKRQPKPDIDVVVDQLCRYFMRLRQGIHIQKLEAIARAKRHPRQIQINGLPHLAAHINLLTRDLQRIVEKLEN